MQVKNKTIDDTHEGQRIDNYLKGLCKGVPKTRLYRALRKGEVRVNKKRVKPDYKLQLGDVVRIPPLRQPEAKPTSWIPTDFLHHLEACILQETDCFIIIDKPAGIPVHGGTGIKTGLIEALRVVRPKCQFLELAHRLDRATSGCLVIAKKRSFLLRFHECLVRHHVKKRYWALVKGRWEGGVQRVQAPLLKNHLASGERVVIVSDEGKSAQTIFRPVTYFDQATLVEAELVTGRTHQIRVHAAHLGRPIAGDEKYGDREFNKIMSGCGVNRLFLHSFSVYCRWSSDPDQFIGICAPLDCVLSECMSKI